MSATQPSAPEDVHWPLPIWGAAVGLLFILVATSGLGAMLGFLVAFSGMMLAIPLLSLSGEAAAPFVAAAGVLLLALAVLGPPVAATLRARTRAQRARSLNLLVALLMIVAGLALSIDSMKASWP